MGGSDLQPEPGRGGPSRSIDGGRPASPIPAENAAFGEGLLSSPQEAHGAGDAGDEQTQVRSSGEDPPPAAPALGPRGRSAEAAQSGAAPLNATGGQPAVEEAVEDEVVTGAGSAPADDSTVSGPDSWSPAAGPRDLAAELRRIEARIRILTERIDNKRKRRLDGTRRWLDLHDELSALRFTGALSEADIQTLLSLIARRQRIFRRLNFAAGTRPTWNS